MEDWADPLGVPQMSAEQRVAEAVRQEGLRIRRELTDTLKAWTGGCRLDSFRMDVARDLYAALDRICPEEG